MKPTRRLDRWRRLAPVLGVAMLVAGWASAPASAQEDGAAERLVLRAVDATKTDVVNLVVAWSGDPSDVEGLVVHEDGDEVDAQVVGLADVGLRSDVVFVFDTSVTTDENALLAQAQEAVSAMVAELPPDTRAAVVIAGGGSQSIRGLTSDPERLRQTIDELTPAGEGAVLSGVVRAASVASSRGTVPTVVLITDGVQNSVTSLQTAQGALLAEGAALYVVGLQDGGLDEGAFGSLAAESGGRMVVTDDVTQIGSLVSDITPEVFGLAAATYAPGDGEGVRDLDVAIDGVRTQGSYVAGSLLMGSSRVGPRPAVEPDGISFFHSGIGRLIGFGAAALACVLFVYGILLLFVRERTALATAMQPYADSYVADSEEGDGVLAGSAAFLKRAVSATGGFAERQGVLSRIEKSLEQADLPLRAPEALFFYLAGLVLVLVALLALTQNLLAMLVVGLIIALVPPAALNILATRKKKQFEALLPDTLQLLSSTLRAGYSMMQGVEAVSQEAAEPMGKELRRVVTEARLGRPLEESLEAIAERMDSGDFAWAVMAIRIQREVGGNLSELLMTVAETMTQRERLRRDVNSLTAEGRISAYVLIALPVGLGGFLWTVNPDYIGKLFDHTLGQIMLGGSVLGIIAGYAWMMKIIKIEI